MRTPSTRSTVYSPQTAAERARPVHLSAASAFWELILIATIDDLLSKVDSKYTLVHLSARRAREINSYYHSLGEGLGQFTPPLVDQVDSNKPLSIALEEIAAEKIIPQYPGDARRAAEELFGADLADADFVGEDADGDRTDSVSLVALDPDADTDTDTDGSDTDADQ